MRVYENWTNTSDYVVILPGESKKSTRFVGCEIQSIRLIFKTEILGSVWLVIPNLRNSENGRPRADRNTFPNQTKFFNTAGFRFILMKTRFPVEKHDYECCPCHPPCWKICPGSITVATRAKSPHFQSFSNENENLSRSVKPALQSRRFSRPSKPANPAVLGIWESIKHEFWVYLVYHFQNW